uniref:shikimate kinase n=1 Tax=Paulinella chromatophora TaxID=39717 RepID=B1X462_PAUCH|nr:shikimate kinase [Paulinella chromatophora]ACB42731.1 shikimate kinase [Paulinella chromatophora]
MKNSELTKHLQGLNIYLVGIMGSGKSTIGKPLATALNYSFADTDDVLENATGQNISDIFSVNGESHFRSLEHKVLSEISHYHSLVVATGGGVVINSNNWGIMHQGIVVWLDLAPNILFKRLSIDTKPRPLLKNSHPKESLKILMAKRRSLYGEADIHILSNNHSPDEVAKQILEALPGILKVKFEFS